MVQQNIQLLFLVSLLSKKKIHQIVNKLQYYKTLVIRQFIIISLFI